MPDASFRDFVLDQLAPLAVDCRGMFGGFGLYHERRFFGILFKGRLYFKTDAQSRPGYEARGMRPFQPSAKQTLRTYYEVPPEVLEDADELLPWARRAIKCRTTGGR